MINPVAGLANIEWQYFKRFEQFHRDLKPSLGRMASFSVIGDSCKVEGA